MKLFVRKINNALHPTDEFSKENMGKLSQDNDIEVECRIPRNVDFHRKFFAMINLAFQNLIECWKYGDEEVFRRMVIAEAGFVVPIGEAGDKIVVMPESISFSNMDNERFQQVYDRVLDVILNKYMPGTDKDDFNTEVMRMLNFV